MLSLSKSLFTLPPRLSTLAEPDFQNDPLWKAATQAAKAGRSSLSVKLWGLIEEKLLLVLHQIADTIIADPSLDLDQAIRKPVEQQARILSLTLAQ